MSDGKDSKTPSSPPPQRDYINNRRNPPPQPGGIESINEQSTERPAPPPSKES